MRLVAAHDRTLIVPPSRDGQPWDGQADGIFDAATPTRSRRRSSAASLDFGFGRFDSFPLEALGLRSGRDSVDELPAADDEELSRVLLNLTLFNSDTLRSEAFRLLQRHHAQRMARLGCHRARRVRIPSVATRAACSAVRRARRARTSHSSGACLRLGLLTLYRVIFSVITCRHCAY